MKDNIAVSANGKNDMVVCRKELEAVQNYLTLLLTCFENLTPEAECEGGYLYAGQS